MQERKQYLHDYYVKYYDTHKEYYKKYYQEHKAELDARTRNRLVHKVRKNVYADFYLVLKDGEIVKKFKSMKGLSKFMGMPHSTMRYYLDTSKTIYGYQLKRFYKGVKK